ncbi:MAG: hypothetical protein M3R08_01210 [Bacteroidota bacterium]|nr:hypothetical protein [Bacteroidota bacterium]
MTGRKKPPGLVFIGSQLAKERTSQGKAPFSAYFIHSDHPLNSLILQIWGNIYTMKKSFGSVQAQLALITLSKVDSGTIYVTAYEKNKSWEIYFISSP